MAYVDFLSAIHKATKRDYVARVNEFPKAEAAKLAKLWDKDYWDGDRKTGYGGYRYDGRWRKVADALVAHYGIKPGDRILDIGCGKGFLLYDLTQACPGVIPSTLARHCSGRPCSGWDGTSCPLGPVPP